MIINCQQNVSTILNSTHSDSAIINSAENATIGKRRFKLPKLELRKFEGDVKEWLYFWNQFEKIHDDSSIEDSDKFQYLLQSAVLRAFELEKVIESKLSAGDDYPKAIDCLKTNLVVMIYK
ncbi:hypothetical protein AVEN_238410-1 [Araneus ventricosus]|uniref:Uncharacterized protein n=1 Tax=Araneus ventricosus TaxID=182803 RepID=A0A4Y2DML9_ARAVE|nr:hypothetical protein AVEN_238410-1 [Araneus ventricosus]